MKKALLTLGTLAATATPLATTVACDESSVLVVAVSGDKLTIAGFKFKEWKPGVESDDKEYLEFMENIGKEIAEVENTSEIKYVNISGKVVAYNGTGFDSADVDVDLNLALDLLSINPANLEQAIQQAPLQTGLTSKEASLFALLATSAILKG